MPPFGESTTRNEIKRVHRAERPDFDDLEDAGAKRISKALVQWKRGIFRGISADTVDRIISRIDDKDLRRPLDDTLYKLIEEWTREGTRSAIVDLEEQIFGTRKSAKRDGFTVAWDRAHEEASAWARNYAGELIKDVTDTTRDVVRRQVRDFVEDGSQTVNQLASRLSSYPGSPFGPGRARLIAVTEVTRSYYKGSEYAWTRSGVVEKKEWLTSVDELVCPICGPIHGEVVGLREFFSIGVDGPPAHPRCRCDTAPVIADDPARNLTDAQYQEGGGFSPSAGPRAPRPPKTPAPAPEPIIETPIPAESVPEVGDHLNYPAYLRDDIEDAKKRISAVHGNGKRYDVDKRPNAYSRRVDITGKDSKARSTTYGYYRGSASKIYINPAGAHPELTTIHELGHYIDHDFLRIRDQADYYDLWMQLAKSSDDTVSRSWRDIPALVDRAKEVDNAAAVFDWVEAVQETDEFKWYKKVLDGDIKTVKYGNRAGDAFVADVKFSEYRQKMTEHWSRSYEQYIAQKSGDGKLLGQLEVWDGAHGYPRNYAKFDRISETIDKIIEDSGWEIRQ